MATSQVVKDSDIDFATLIKSMTDTIVEKFQPIRVVLFGSLARGTATKYSDIDLLVVMPDGIDRRETAISIQRAFTALRIGKDIVVTTSDAIKKTGNVCGFVTYYALREGITLYAQNYSKVDECKMWFAYAKDDMEFMISRHVDMSPSMICWISHRVIVSLLKSVLVLNSIQAPFTADVYTLYNSLPRDWSIKKIHKNVTSRLTRIAIQYTRKYSKNIVKATSIDAQNALCVSQEAYDTIQNRLLRAGVIE